VINDPTHTVLLLAGRLNEHDDGGSMMSLLERLAQQGIAARVLCTARGDATDDRIIERPGLGGRWPHAFAARCLRFDQGLSRPELLHIVHPIMSAVGLAIADHWKIPYVQTVDEFLPPEGRIRLSRRWCQGLIVASRELAEDLVQDLDIPRDFLAVVPPGITVPKESAVTAHRGVVPVIGTAGPLVASSGLATFLKAARRVLDAGMDAEFVIAGQGAAEVDLRRRAGRLRIADRVTFAGRHVVGLRFWRVLDLFCQTSLIPTVGRTLATAMAFGVPVIASDLEGLRALVKPGETGVRIPPGNSSALARTILELLADPVRTRALGQAGRELIRRNFDPAAEARQLAALYRRVLSGGGAQAPRMACA
jgi:glycosyltransferase involved in cell wall biosynthesis